MECLRSPSFSCSLYLTVGMTSRHTEEGVRVLGGLLKLPSGSERGHARAISQSMLLHIEDSGKGILPVRHGMGKRPSKWSPLARDLAEPLILSITKKEAERFRTDFLWSPTLHATWLATLVRSRRRAQNASATLDELLMETDTDSAYDRHSRITPKRHRGNIGG